MKQVEKETLDSQIALNFDEPRLTQDISPGTTHPTPSILFQTVTKGVYDQVNQYFSEQDKQKRKVQEAREILGESAASMSDEEVYDLTNEMQYLVQTWIEEYERDVFDGKTLKELLQL